MEPLIGPIALAVFLFLVREFVAFLLIWIPIIIGFARSHKTDSIGPAIGGVLIGIVLLVGWEIFAIAWIIGDAIHIVQLATAGAPVF